MKLKVAVVFGMMGLVTLWIHGFILAKVLSRGSEVSARAWASDPFKTLQWTAIGLGITAALILMVCVSKWLWKRVLGRIALGSIISIGVLVVIFSIKEKGVPGQRTESFLNTPVKVLKPAIQTAKWWDGYKNVPHAASADSRTQLPSWDAAQPIKKWPISSPEEVGHLEYFIDSFGNMCQKWVKNEPKVTANPFADLVPKTTEIKTP